MVITSQEVLCLFLGVAGLFTAPWAMSVATCSASSETSDTRAKCVETSHARRFLVRYFAVFAMRLVICHSLQDVLSKLPRPQVMVEDAQFLTYYSLQAQQLTLTDILSESASSKWVYNYNYYNVWMHMYYIDAYGVMPYLYI